MLQVYQNKITLLKTGDRDLGWGELSVESMDIHMIPANHLTMLKKPHVQVLAEQLKACMINSLTNPSC
ncbi:MAG: hypothetical protein PUP93_24570 [Rhizonema sp. NSF051]|nr:hypothetical protein [Rhizonema sp. NSF051]